MHVLVHRQSLICNHHGGIAVPLNPSPLNHPPPEDENKSHSLKYVENYFSCRRVEELLASSKSLIWHDYDDAYESARFSGTKIPPINGTWFDRIGIASCMGSRQQHCLLGVRCAWVDLLTTWNQQNKRHIERACARQLQPIGLVCLSVGLSIARPCFCTQFIYSIERINIHLLIDSFIHSACRACFIQCIVVVVVFKSLPTLDCSWIFYSLVDVSHVSPVFFTI